MKKKTVVTKRAPKRAASAKSTPARTDSLAPLVAEVRGLIQSARRGVASVVDTFQVLTNFEIGRRIIEHEQQGEKRAAYGKELLKELSARLTEEFGRGFSEDNLARMRKFYVLWKDRDLEFPRSLRGNLEGHVEPIGSTVPTGISAKPSRKSPFTLSWSHYVLLSTIKDPGERSFYEIEATSEGWSVPELKRQTASCLYERLALSRDKSGVKKLAEKGQLITRPEDVLKEPLVLEFLGLDERTRYSETTVGLLLCKKKKDAIVKLTLPEDANIHAREYQLYLPSQELLKAKLLEWTRDAERAE